MASKVFKKLIACLFFALLLLPITALAEEQWQGPGYHQADPDRDHQPGHRDERQEERFDHRDDRQLSRDYKWGSSTENHAGSLVEHSGREK